MISAFHLFRAGTARRSQSATSLVRLLTAMLMVAMLLIAALLFGSTTVANATIPPPSTNPPSVTTTTSKSMKYLDERLFITGIGRVGSTLQCEFSSHELTRGAGAGVSPGSFTWFDASGNRIFGSTDGRYVVRAEDVGNTVTCALKQSTAEYRSTAFFVSNAAGEQPTGKVTISAPSPTSQANLTCTVETSATILGYRFDQGRRNGQGLGTTESNDGSSVQDSNDATCFVFLENAAGKSILISELRTLPPPPKPPLGKLISPMRIVGSGRVGTTISCIPPNYKPARAILSFTLTFADDHGNREPLTAPVSQKLTRRITKAMLIPDAYFECAIQFDEATYEYSKRVLVRK
jgi:hypothetical protein